MNPNCIPAFPSHGSMGEVAQEGMSLRDYFAAMALNAMLGNTAIMNFSNEVIATLDIGRADWLSDQSYKFADAMLKAREA